MSTAADENGGREPDPRYTLANERTFLAWNRTALALIGGGLAAGQLLHFSSEAARLVVALPPVVLGSVVAVTSHAGWRRRQEALRRDEALPQGDLQLLLSVGIALIGIVIAVALIADDLG